MGCLIIIDILGLVKEGKFWDLNISIVSNFWVPFLKKHIDNPSVLFHFPNPLSWY